MATTLNVGDTVECVVKKVETKGVTVSLPDGRAGYVPKYCAQSLCDSDGFFSVKIGDPLTLEVKEVGQPIRLGDDEEPTPAPPPPPVGPKILGKIDLAAASQRRRPQHGRRDAAADYKVGDIEDGTVGRVQTNGVYVSLRRGGTGFLPAYVMDMRDGAPPEYRKGDKIRVGILAIKDYIRLCGEERMRRKQQKNIGQPAAQTIRRYVPMVVFDAEHSAGDTVHAKVVSVDERRAIISVAQGVVWKDEMSWTPFERPLDILRTGDNVDAVYMGRDDRHNRLLFSIRRSEAEPPDAWRMTQEEVDALHQDDPDPLSATARYAVGDTVRARVLRTDGDTLHFDLGNGDASGYAFREMFPALTDEACATESDAPDGIDAVVAYVGGRVGLCDKSVWAERRPEVETLFAADFAQHPQIRSLASRIYSPGDVVEATIADIDEDRIAMLLPRGGLGFLPKEQKFDLADEERSLNVGGLQTVVVERVTKQGVTLCDKALWDLQTLHIGTSLRSLYKVGEPIVGEVVEHRDGSAIVPLPKGGNGILRACHASPSDDKTTHLPPVGTLVEAVVFQVGAHGIMLCDKQRWEEIQERQRRRPSDFFSPGDNLTTRVIYSTKSGIYVALPTSGKGFWPVYNITGYTEGSKLPHRGETISGIVQKVTEKGVILCDKAKWDAQKEQENS